ncbi:hypothetical protein N0V84_007293 [Fusarium piperis]|uniref:Uncharacterized protein n=1 Tax=Fusarium piperis TaxID=1435070 RepID=A0A9W8WAB1_9HYPO|nr:hypothetical protein N0V84_007293 [Fusarium piperis]
MYSVQYAVNVIGPRIVTANDNKLLKGDPGVIAVSGRHKLAAFGASQRILQGAESSLMSEAWGCRTAEGF